MANKNRSLNNKYSPFGTAVRRMVSLWGTSTRGYQRLSKGGHMVDVTPQIPRRTEISKWIVTVFTKEKTVYQGPTSHPQTMALQVL